MWNYMSRTVVALALACVGYMLVYRPLQLRWGATQEEVQRAMLGDEVRPKPVFNATRAITIRAKAEQAWPWIVQIGYRRAGWYFVFASESGTDSMAIGLYPLEEDHTRLVWRIRLGPYNWKSLYWQSRYEPKAMRVNPQAGCTAN